MKTLKKLFSVSAIVALLGTLAPMYAFGANYSDELEEAYAYAYKNGITTMSSIDNANMFGSLTRIAMAKMIANYATTVLGLEPDTSKSCSFTDVTAALDAQYDNGVRKACQLGLMGQNITAFRPNDLVTRAEFGTTLSRALNSNDADKLADMNAANPYYKEHLNFLNGKGIMKDISNPSMTEVRGYVMLMMMRADDSYQPAEECTLEERVACLLGDNAEACLAACEGEDPAEEQDSEEVKAGTLNVTMTSENGGDIPNWVSSLPVATYTLKATDEDVNVTSLVVKQGGYGDEDTITGAALFIDGARVSKVRNLDLNKEVTLNLNSAYTIKAGKSVDIELRIANENNSTSQFTIELVDVNSSAEKVKLPSKTVSNTFKFVGTDTAELTLEPTTALDNPKVGTKGAELFEIKMSQTDGEDQDILVSSFTLLASDKDLADHLENIKLVLDNEVVAKGTMDGKYLTFVFNTPYTLEKNKKAIFTVVADVIGGAGEEFWFTLETMMDVVATAKAYDAPVNVYAYPMEFDHFSVKAGRVTIDRENPSATTFIRNRSNLYLGSFTIKNNAGGSLYLQDFTLDVEGDAGVIDSLKVRYGSTTAGLIVLDSNNSDDTEVSIGSKLTVYLYADIDDVPVTGKNFKISLKDVSIEDGDDNELEDTDISYPASWLQMKGTASALNVTKVNLADKSFAKGAENIDAVSFKVKTNNVDGVKIKRFTFTTDAAVTTTTVRSAKLYVGDESYDATVQAGSIKVANTINLDADTTTTFTLKVNLTSNPTVTGGFVYTLTSIEAEDTSADRNDLSDDSYSIAGREISVAENGKLTVTMENTDNNKYAKSILAGTEAIIAEYQLKTTYEDVDVDTITLTFSDAIAARVSDVELAYGDTIVSNALISGTKATFTDVDLNLTTTKTPLTVKLITKTIDSDNGTGTLKNVTLNSVVFSDMVGKDTGNPIDNAAGLTGKAFDVVPATVTASVTSSTNTQTKLNLFVNKGDNELDDGDITITLTGLALSITSNTSGLELITVKNSEGTTIMTGVDSLNYVASEAEELSAGDNEYTIYYTVGAANTPSYSVDLTDVKFTTSLDTTTEWSSRMATTLNLVNR